MPICLSADNLDGAKKARAEAVAALSRVSFLYGPESSVTKSAETLTKALGEFIRNPEDRDWGARFKGADPFDAF